MDGNYILRLTTVTGIDLPENLKSDSILIYPNPMNDYSTVRFYPPVAGEVTVSVYDITGKMLMRVNSFLESEIQKFNLSGLKNGLYIISVQGNGYRYSGKLICEGETGGTIKLEKLANEVQVVIKKETEKTSSKESAPIVDMEYTAGDRLKITGTSGIYSTVIMDIPEADKIISFDFVACTDGNSNNYPVVTIGTQVWMAENLKATKYSSGTDITQATTEEEWAGFNATGKGYCYYEFDPANATAYGVLYNWIAAVDGAASTSSEPSGVQGVCPVGWHIPSMPEWITLTTCLGSNPGLKLKETGTTHWSDDASYVGTNESGFTAVGGGLRQNSTFGFANKFISGLWWSTTDGPDAGSIKDLVLTYDAPGASPFNSISKAKGISVRCIKD